MGSSTTPQCSWMANTRSGTPMKQSAEEEFLRGMALPQDCEPASRYKICCGTGAPGVEGSTACVIMGCPRHLEKPGSTGTYPSIGIPKQHPTQGHGLSDVKQGCWVQPSGHPTWHQPERKGIQTVEAAPMKPRQLHRLARRVSGPRSCGRSKRHLRHADKISPTQDLVRRNGEGV